MTEYDFSPEAYQAHLANMSRISRWVDRTEEHRSEFTNAAALTEQQRAIRDSHSSSPPASPERRNSFGGRRRNTPPPLPLHPYGTPDPAYAAMGMGIGMSPYASPMHSDDGSEMNFRYASGPGSPGPMPPQLSGYPGYPMPRSAGVQMMVMAPPLMSPPLMSAPPVPPHHTSRSRRSRSNSFSLAPPPQFAGAPYMGMGAPSPVYAPPGPSYVILPPTPTRHHRSGRHRGHHPGVSYVYV